MLQAVEIDARQRHARTRRRLEAGGGAAKGELNETLALQLDRQDPLAKLGGLIRPKGRNAWCGGLVQPGGEPLADGAKRSNHPGPPVRNRPLGIVERRLIDLDPPAGQPAAKKNQIDIQSMPTLESETGRLDPGSAVEGDGIVPKGIVRPTPPALPDMPHACPQSCRRSAACRPPRSLIQS